MNIVKSFRIKPFFVPVIVCGIILTPLEIPETGTIIEKARFLKGLAQSI